MSNFVSVLRLGAFFAQLWVGRTIAQGLVAGISSRRPGFASREVQVRFAVVKIALGRIFSESFRFPLSLSFIPRMFRSHSCM